jgi:hypothetical protein
MQISRIKKPSIPGARPSTARFGWLIRQKPADGQRYCPSQRTGPNSTGNGPCLTDSPFWGLPLFSRLKYLRQDVSEAKYFTLAHQKHDLTDHVRLVVRNHELPNSERNGL